MARRSPARCCWLGKGGQAHKHRFPIRPPPPKSPYVTMPSKWKWVWSPTALRNPFGVTNKNKRQSGCCRPTPVDGSAKMKGDFCQRRAPREHKRMQRWCGASCASVQRTEANIEPHSTINTALLLGVLGTDGIVILNAEAV